MFGYEQEETEEENTRLDSEQNSNKNLQVFVRLCPPEQRNYKTDEARSSIKVIEPNRVVVDTGKGHQPHVLDVDSVWNECATQRDIYVSTAKPLVGLLMQGYNGCVIVYGTPASGKTFTLLGGSLAGKQRGILSRAAEDIFNSPGAAHHKVSVSFYHISNDKIYDLLESQPVELTRIHDGEEPVQVEGLTEVEVCSTQALLQLYRRGSANRHTGIVKGDFASRSHAVFSITVMKPLPQVHNGGVWIASKLTLVDLASPSKPTCHSTAAVEVRQCFHAAQENPQEAKILKRTLTIFGNVIFALSTAGCPHIPYRESKLTRALRGCLGGNCRTSLIVTVSSQRSSVTETLSCLHFASRAMAVPGRPVHPSHLHYSPPQSPPQTCLPPIPRGPVAPLRTSQRRGEEQEPEPRAFLPRLDKTGFAEPGDPQSHQPGRGPPEKSGAESVRSARCQSRGLAPRRSAERLSSSSLGPSSAPPAPPAPPAPGLSAAPAPPECPGCRRERRIRGEYDKFIVQTRRDRDALGQRVAELEAALQRRGPGEAGGGTAVSTTTTHSTTQTTDLTQDSPVADLDGAPPLEKSLEVQRPEGNSTRAGRDERLHLELENNQMKMQIVCLRQEVEALRAEVDGFAEREKVLEDRLHTEQSRALWDTQHPSSLHNHRESLLAELQVSEVERGGKVRENMAHTIAQLHKEKDELMLHIEDTKRCYENVKSENAALRDRVEALLQETTPMPYAGSHGNAGRALVHTVTTNTEMLVVSHHHVSQQSITEVPQESKCCFAHSGGYQEHAESGCAERPLAQPDVIEPPPNQNKHHNLLKQLRREHSLLLDVMLLLYRREWFVHGAMPYVRRTLRKCGLRPEDLD